MTPETAKVKDTQEEARVRAFRAEFARFREMNRELLADPHDAALAERVARSFWNSALSWELSRIVSMHRVGLL